MAEYVCDYDGWAAAMSDAVGPAWSYGIYRAIARIMRKRRRERITRCRDCRWAREALPRERWHLECCLRPLAHYYTDDDGFCHLGEPRKEDE